MSHSQVQLKVRSKSMRISASSIIAGLAIMLPLQASFAQSQYISKLSTYCANLGSTSKVTTCTDCHTSSNASGGNATTAAASQYRAGNYGYFCTASIPTPTATPRATPTPSVTPKPSVIPTPSATPRPSVTPRPSATPTPVVRPTPAPGTGARSDDDHGSSSPSPHRRRSSSRSDD